MTKFVEFLKDEDGAITIEWVALAAGVVILALGIVSVLNPELENLATDIASDLAAEVSSLAAVE